MLLASNIKDMNFEEILSIFKPVLYLVPITIVAILVLIGIKIYKALAVKRMLSYMKQKGLDEADKRNYLKNYLTRTSNRDLIYHYRNCPVCGKKYSLKVEKVNSYGDTVEEWNNDGCTFCNTKVFLSNDAGYIKYYKISRKPTDSVNEAKWQKVYNQLEDYIDYYKPFVDTTPDNTKPDSSSGDSITININIR